MASLIWFANFVQRSTFRSCCSKIARALSMKENPSTNNFVSNFFMGIGVLPSSSSLTRYCASNSMRFSFVSFSPWKSNNFSNSSSSRSKLSFSLSPTKLVSMFLVSFSWSKPLNLLTN